MSNNEFTTLKSWVLETLLWLAQLFLTLVHFKLESSFIFGEELIQYIFHIFNYFKWIISRKKKKSTQSNASIKDTVPLTKTHQRLNRVSCFSRTAHGEKLFVFLSLSCECVACHKPKLNLKTLPVLYDPGMKEAFRDLLHIFTLYLSHIIITTVGQGYIHG